MPYTQTLIDNFNDASINTSIWDQIGTSGVTESGGFLNVPGSVAYPQIQSTPNRNLANGILASKLTRAGTPSDGTELYVGVHDGAGNYVQVISNPGQTWIDFRVYGAATVSSVVTTDFSIGLGPGWTNGHWVGMGNMGSDNIIRLYKSSDGQTWTELIRATVGGTFNKTTAGLYYMGGMWDSGGTFVAQMDDASYWLSTGTSTTQKMKVRVGSVWVSATPKVRVGGVWVTAKPKARSGGVWVAPKQ